VAFGICEGNLREMECLSEEDAIIQQRDKK